MAWKAAGDDATMRIRGTGGPPVVFTRTRESRPCHIKTEFATTRHIRA